MYDIKKWSETTIKKVWDKAIKSTPENEVKGFRKDKCYTWMLFEKHGDRNSEYGWEIDHIKPVAHGGTDDLFNLQPLQWENNVEKGDSSVLKCKRA